MPISASSLVSFKTLRRDARERQRERVDRRRGPTHAHETTPSSFFQDPSSSCQSSSGGNPAGGSALLLGCKPHLQQNHPHRRVSNGSSGGSWGLSAWLLRMLRLCRANACVCVCVGVAQKAACFRCRAQLSIRPCGGHAAQSVNRWRVGER